MYLRREQRKEDRRHERENLQKVLRSDSEGMSQMPVLRWQAMNDLYYINKFVEAGYELSVRKMDSMQPNGKPFFHAAVFKTKPSSGHNHIGRSWEESITLLNNYLAGIEP